METQTKQCQNCHNNFEITPEDFEFYEKIKVPSPTFCPECRMIRRMQFRNERTLYKRKCNLCNKDILSIYNSQSPFTIYCFDCYYSDNWDSSEFGRDYNFEKPFFEQFRQLIIDAPKLAAQKGSDLFNSEYTNHVGALKNCYLLFASVDNEDCMYCTHTNQSKNSIDNYSALKNQLCYECIDCQNSYNLKFSAQCQSCNDSWFLFNCRSCSDCFSCTNLIHKSYCINNQQYSKEEYQNFIKNLETGSAKNIINNIEKFNLLKNKTIRKSMEGVNNISSSGNYLKNTKNCKYCFDVSEAENCKFLGYTNNAKDVMDGYAVYPTTEFSYEVAGSGVGAYRNLFTYLPWGDASDLIYCINAFYSCKNCFGCTQIRKKQYCILNKQYTKEEYEELVPKIIQHMSDMPYKAQIANSQGQIIKEIVYKYGEFFPPQLSPFAYNETVAQEYFPLTKEQAIEQGYGWKDPEERNIKITLTTDQIPDHIKDVDDSILTQVIGCEHKGTCNEQCTQAFKIIKQELEFYRKMNLPLPRLCPNCRHYQRIKQRNPLKLWKRKCMCQGNQQQLAINQQQDQFNKLTNSPINQSTHFHGDSPCPNEFETTYSSDGPEIVYCETCYQQEVV